MKRRKEREKKEQRYLDDVAFQFLVLSGIHFQILELKEGFFISRKELT